MKKVNLHKFTHIIKKNDAQLKQKSDKQPKIKIKKSNHLIMSLLNKTKN